MIYNLFVPVDTYPPLVDCMPPNILEQEDVDIQEIQLLSC